MLKAVSKGWQPGPPEAKAFSRLSVLFDGWFHQDLDIDGPDLATIIPKFANASWKTDVQGTITDIDEFLDLYGKDDRTLHEAVERILEPGIIVEGWEGLTTREWLLRIAELLSKSLADWKDEPATPQNV